MPNPSNTKKALVIGLDSAPPELLFNAFINDLPNLKKLLQHEVHARIESTHPPITIPAWMVLATSKNMEKLGLYGFRHRKPGTYNEIWLANSYSVKEKTVLYTEMLKIWNKPLGLPSVRARKRSRVAASMEALEAYFTLPS